MLAQLGESRTNVFNGSYNSLLRILNIVKSGALHRSQRYGFDGCLRPKQPSYEHIRVVPLGTSATGDDALIGDHKGKAFRR